LGDDEKVTLEEYRDGWLSGLIEPKNDQIEWKKFWDWKRTKEYRDWKEHNKKRLQSGKEPRVVYHP
jgi:hypothetical protein